MEAYDIEAKLLSVQTRLLYIQDINCNPSGNQQEDIQYIYIYIYTKENVQGVKMICYKNQLNKKNEVTEEVRNKKKV